jgi:hypothetical protein
MCGRPTESATRLIQSSTASRGSNSPSAPTTYSASVFSLMTPWLKMCTSSTSSGVSPAAARQIASATPAADGACASSNLAHEYPNRLSALVTASTRCATHGSAFHGPAKLPNPTLNARRDLTHPPPAAAA